MADNLDPDVQTWTRDWRRLRRQKHRHSGGIEGSMLLDYLLYEGEHQAVQVQKAIMMRAFKHERDKNKLRLVIPLARKAADRRIGRLWSIAHRYTATPNVKDPVAFDRADVIGGQLIPALDHKAQQNTLRWKIFTWLVTCGVCFEHVDWKDAVTQDVLPKYDEQTGDILFEDTLTGEEVPESVVEAALAQNAVLAERFQPAVEVQTAGDIGSDVYDPFRVFIDASVPSVKDLGPDQRIFLADLRSLEWVEDTFGSQAASRVKPMRDVSIIETQLLDKGMPVSGLNLKDLLPLVQGSQDKDDPDLCIVLTVYQPPSKKHPLGRRGFFVPDQAILDKSDLPYPEIPVVDYHWSAPGASMWTRGFMRDLQALSKFINKRFSQMGEAANAQIYEMLLLGGTLSEKDIPTDFPGVVKGGIDPDTGQPLVQVVPRGNLPAFFPDSIRLSMETLDAIGGSDLMANRKFPGQLRGSLTVPMLQEILDSEDGPRYSHLAEQFAIEKMMRINRVKQFYPPIRTLNYTGEDLRNEVLELHTDELLRAGVDYTVTVDPGSIFPEISSMREARVRERMQWAPGLYTNPRTGTMDWSKVAQDLRYNDRFRDSLESAGRKLARQITQRVRQGKILVQDGMDPQTGQPKPQLVTEDGQPFIVYPFWAHNSMMDEYEAIMQTTEFLDASPGYKRTLLVLHDAHRRILAQIDQARQNSVENKMVQGAVAQATQQAAAKAASIATEAAIEQVIEQQQTPPGGLFDNVMDQVRQLVGGAQAAGVRPEGPPTGGPPQVVGRRRLPGS